MVSASLQIFMVSFDAAASLLNGPLLVSQLLSLEKAGALAPILLRYLLPICCSSSVEANVVFDVSTSDNSDMSTSDNSSGASATPSSSLDMEGMGGISSCDIMVTSVSLGGTKRVKSESPKNTAPYPPGLKVSGGPRLLRRRSQVLLALLHALLSSPCLDDWLSDEPLVSHGDAGMLSDVQYSVGPS
jgi:hypothetical protein